MLEWFLSKEKRKQPPSPSDICPFVLYINHDDERAKIGGVLRCSSVMVFLGHRNRGVCRDVTHFSHLILGLLLGELDNACCDEVPSSGGGGNGQWA